MKIVNYIETAALKLLILQPTDYETIFQVSFPFTIWIYIVFNRILLDSLS